LRVSELNNFRMMFIIDGHNLLHSIQKDSPESGPISDVRLCRIIGSYLRLTGQKGEIIFDGTGPPDKSGFDGINNLEVFFAGFTTDTDTVIEDKIISNSAPRRLKIVSSDRRLRRAAKARKAISIKSEDFWSNMQKQLSREKKPKEPTAKRRGLSESETSRWLEIFGLEQ